VRLSLDTLEEEKEELELEKEEVNLEWKDNEESGRSLTSTPLFTDGQLIYVISRRLSHKAEEVKQVEEEANESEPVAKHPQLVVEIYDPSTPAHSLVREVPLYKTADLE
jgi:hypothetical protein